MTLTRPLNHKQQGFSFFALLFWLALLGSILLIGMKAVPILTEYTTAKKALHKAAGAGTPIAIKQEFDNYLSAGYAQDFNSSYLIFQSAQGKPTVGFAYDRKIELFGPVSLLFEFAENEYVR